MTHQLRPDRAPGRLRLGGLLAVLPVLAVLAAGGCGIEAPQAPSFHADLHIPTGRFVYTVEELLDREENLHADTTGTVILRIERNLDPISLRDSLHADVPGIDLVASVGEIPLRIRTPPEQWIRIGDLLGLEIPPEGVRTPVPPFSFPPAEAEIPPFEEFREGSILSGSMEIRIANELPIAIAHLTVRLFDVALGRAIDTFGISDPILPRDTASVAIDLSGRRIGNRLRLDLLSGASPGSADPVLFLPEDGIGVLARFGELRFEELEAPIPPRAIERADSTLVEESFRLDSARVDRTEVTIRLESQLPLPAEVSVALPDVEEGGRVWMRGYRMPAGSVEAPARLDVVETIEEAMIVLPDRENGQPLRYRLRVETDGSGEDVVLLTSVMRASARIEPFRLSLESLTGLFPPRDIEVDPIRIALEIPDEITGVAFVEGDLIAEIENGIPLSGAAALSASASGPDTTHRARIDGEIAAGEPDRPVETRLLVDETQPGLLDLLNLLPEEVLVEGSLRIGDPERRVTIHADDSVRGRIALRAPVSVRIGDALYEPDPFRIRVSADTQDRIRERVEDAAATLRVTNRLPVGATVRLQFAADSAGVYDSPALILRAVRIPPATVDPATGRVAEPAVSEHEIPLSQDELRFFARDEAYGGVRVAAAPTGQDRVTLGAADAIEIDGFLRIRFRVGDR